MLSSQHSWLLLVDMTNRDSIVQLGVAVTITMRQMAIRWCVHDWLNSKSGHHVVDTIAAHVQRICLTKVGRESLH